LAQEWPLPGEDRELTAHRFINWPTAREIVVRHDQAVTR
jgi:hypothetical protein